MELNDKQRQAAEFTFGTASVLAIPGSAGKTATMAARIGNLVQSGIPPEKILGLTFTRNAVGAIRNKLRPVLLDPSSRVTLSTLHSFCHRLLKEEGRTFEMLQGPETSTQPTLDSADQQGYRHKNGVLNCLH